MFLYERQKLFSLLNLIRYCQFIVLIALPILLEAQSITGTIQDPKTGESLFGAAILEKGTSNGVVTDFDGKFSLKPEGELPIDLVITYVGYKSQEIKVENFDQNIKIKLESENIQLESVNVTESRITAKQQESPVTVESMDAMAVKETPAVNFYDGLGHLKGVDLTSASMGFKIVNTRGFNSTSPVRTLQLIDGIDNQAPGLNFSVGNFAGVNDLDVQRVELIVGANSSLYGPNAFNGVIAMETKSPFIHRGLTVMGKVGERNLREMGFRYADAHKVFGSDYDNFAYKLNFHYMEAYDWVADNYEPTEQSKNGRDNPGGYDAVNRYGDENLVPGQYDYNDSRGRIFQPGLGIFHRTGYNEEDLVDYDTKNIKFSPSIHYRFKNQSEVKLTYNYGTGTTVYQGDNRYSLKDLQIHQFIAEYSRKDKFSVRVYRTQEDAGKSYDAVFTALLLQSEVKSDARWGQEYASIWTREYADSVREFEGYPDPFDRMYEVLWLGDTRDSIYYVVDMVLAENVDKLSVWQGITRDSADGQGTLSDNKGRYVPGTPEFEKAFSRITSTSTFLEGGAAFYDKSALNHGVVEYTFDESEFNNDWLKIRTGVSSRLYEPDSRGTIFSDTNGRKITNWEVGAYLGAQFRVYNEKLLLSLTGRVDKNQNFDPVSSPAASVVFSPESNQTFRMSFSSAIRNPTLADQYLYYNVGRAILIGNIEGYDSLVTVPSFFDSYSGQFFNRDTLSYFDVAPVRPEKVRTIEVGYKGSLAENRVFIDLSYYYSTYRDFLGYVIGADIAIDDSLNQGRLKQIYRVSANSETEVTTQGISIGLNYYFMKYLALSGNYSWNRLNKMDKDDPIVPAYNTPEHKYNIGLSGRDIRIRLGEAYITGIGFSVNYKWIEGFLFEGSPQFTGAIPTYDILDAQVSYEHKRWNTTFKLGASNILDKKNYQTYGGPRIGRMAYFSILYELKYVN